MLRQLSLVLLIACSFGAAPSTTRVRETDFHTLELQAFQLMQVEKLPEAGRKLDVVYNATRPDARSRALVINHAILDLSRPTFVMRAVKDLTAYLAAHPEEDELATNVLGSCLDVAAEKPQVQNGELWKAACAEWERRDAALEKSRGLHRWGTKWLTEQEFADLKEEVEPSKRVIEEQDGHVREAYKNLDDAVIRRNGADAKLPPLQLTVPQPTKTLAERVSVDTTPGPHFHSLSANYAGYHAWTGSWGSGPGTDAAGIYYRGEQKLNIDISPTTAEKDELTRNVQKAEYEFNNQLKRRYELIRSSPRPLWPRRYSAVPPLADTTQPYSIPPTSQPASPPADKVTP